MSANRIYPEGRPYRGDYYHAEAAG